MNSHVGGKNHEWIADRAQYAFGVITRRGDGLFTALEGVDVNEYEHGAVNFVVYGEIGTDAQGKPMPFLVLHLALKRAQVVDNFSEKLIQIRAIEIAADPAKRSADIIGDKIEHLFSQRREAANRQVPPTSTMPVLILR